MPLKKISIKVLPEYQNQRLDQFLAKLLPPQLDQPISKSKIRKLIMAGAVYLNGKRIRIASKLLFSNSQVEIYLNWERLNFDSKSQDIDFQMTPSQILFEDEYLIAIDKPAGIPTQPTLDEARKNLYAVVKKFLSLREKKALTEIYLGMHHRLDRDTSGVIFFTKCTSANLGMAQAFSSRSAEKSYYALSYWNGQDDLQANWEVKNYLGAKKQNLKVNKYVSVRSGGNFAHTEFKLLKQCRNILWIEAKPKTGRTHQIRVHLSEKGLPILGDQTYGGTLQIDDLKIPRMMLHATTLKIPHPITRETLTITSPLPEDFKKCLEIFQKGNPNS